MGVEKARKQESRRIIKKEMAGKMEEKGMEEGRRESEKGGRKEFRTGEERGKGRRTMEEGR